jgi:hypothetical protein
MALRHNPLTKSQQKILPHVCPSTPQKNETFYYRFGVHGYQLLAKFIDSEGFEVVGSASLRKLGF